MRLYRACVAAVIALALADASSSYAAPPETAQAVAVLRIPFAPPLDQNIDYKVVFSRSTPERNTTTEIRQRLRFERSPVGYNLSIETLSLVGSHAKLDLTVLADRNRVPLELRPLLLPMTFELDTTGAILRVRDWPRLKVALLDIPEAIIAMERPADPKAARAMMQTIMQPFQGLSAETAPTVLLRGWPSFLGYGGLELEAGAVYEATNTTDAPLLPVALPTTVKYSLSRSTESNALRLVQTSEPDKAKLGTAMEAYLRQMGANLDAASKANLAKAAAAMRTMTIHDRLDIRFDGQSGLVLSASGERLVSIEALGGSGGETTTISLID